MSDVLLFLPGLIIGVTFHEFSHGLAARALGDRYAQSQGRLTLNPLAHLSLIGFAAFFVLRFGWARPVPINPYNFKKPRRDLLLVALAGPFSNLLLAAVVLPLLPLLQGTWLTVAVAFIYINSILAAVNLLPVPPLDGSRIWLSFVPRMQLRLPRWVSYVWIVILILAIRSGVLTGFLNAIIRLANQVVVAVLY